MPFRGAMLAASMLVACTGMAQAEDEGRIDDLGWMSGSWVSEDEGVWTEEHWTAARGQLMLGVARSGSGDRARSFEFLRIQPDEGGTLVYLAAPGGGEATPFRLVETGPTSVVFENPEHDFPQRIRYWREGDELFAEISSLDWANAVSWSLTLAE